MWVDLELLGSADRCGAMTRAGAEPRRIRGLVPSGGRWPAATYERSCGPTGVSTRCASDAGDSTLAGDTPAVPPLREQLWALRPLLDGGVPALDVFTPDASCRRARGLAEDRHWGAAEAVNAGSCWARDLLDSPRSRPTRVSGDSKIAGHRSLGTAGRQAAGHIRQTRPETASLVVQLHGMTE